MSTKSKNIYYEFDKESKISIGLEYEKYLHQSQVNISILMYLGQQNMEMFYI